MKIDHVENLYRPEAQVILLFKECYAMEKLHGTAAGILFDPLTSNIKFESGGEKHERFVSLFNQEQLIQSFKNFGVPNDKTIKIYGECYGASQQGMSHTYGLTLKFIAFAVKIGDSFLNVPDAEDVVKKLNLEFVDYVKVSTNLSSLDAERDKPSTQSIRNGITTINTDGTLNNPKKREGVVIVPLVEMTMNNGKRVICKHKGSDFMETATARPVVDPSKMKVLEDANSIANEWVTANRLSHVLDQIPNHGMEKMRDIIASMVADVLREGKDEIVESEAVKKAIGKKTVEMYKAYLKSQVV